MRIMIYATAPWAQSGYAMAARNAGIKLKERGHEVAFFAWNTIKSVLTEFHGMVVYPGGTVLTGHDVLAGHIKHFGADVLLTICDPWIVDDPDLWTVHHDAVVVHWHPCQADPCSQWLRMQLESADLGLNYSRWGTKIIHQTTDLTNVFYVPLGVDTSIYHPMDRDECRAWLSKRLEVDLTDRFVVGMVAANASTLPLMRKNFDGQLQAFARFKEQVPNAIMYLHTNRRGIPSGFDLVPLLQRLHLEQGRDVFFPPHWNLAVGFDDNWMAKMYNAIDVLSAATLGEGFGLPILEAQATGTPVVAANSTSMTELTRYGHLAEIGVRQWCPGKVEGFIYIPRVESILDGLIRIYNGSAMGSCDEALALASALEWDNVVDEYLLPTLDEAWDE